MTNDALNQLPLKDGLAQLGAITRADLSHRLSNCFNINELNCLEPRLSGMKWAQFEEEVSRLVKVFSAGFYPLPEGVEVEVPMEGMPHTATARHHALAHQQSGEVSSNAGAQPEQVFAPRIPSATWPVSHYDRLVVEDKKRVEPGENALNRPSMETESPDNFSVNLEGNGPALFDKVPDQNNLAERDGQKRFIPTSQVGTTGRQLGVDALDAVSGNPPSFSFAPLKGLKEFSMLLSLETHTGHPKAGYPEIRSWDEVNHAESNKSELDSSDKSNGKSPIYKEIGGNAMADNRTSAQGNELERQPVDSGNQTIFKGFASLVTNDVQDNGHVHSADEETKSDTNRKTDHSPVPQMDMDEVMDELKQRLNWEYRRHFGE